MSQYTASRYLFAFHPAREFSMQTNYSPSSEINHLLLEPFCLLFNAGIGNQQSEVYKQSFFDRLVLVCEKNRNQMGNNHKIQ